MATRRAPRPCGNAFVTDNRVTLVPKQFPAREERDRESQKSVKRNVAISLKHFVLSQVHLFVLSVLPITVAPAS